MKTICFLMASLFLSGFQMLAQHPLVGTWEMVSGKGIGAEGEKFSFDSSSVRETKIITPTHYMLIAWDVADDSLTFNRTMAGTVRLEGDKYIEIPIQASVQIFNDLKVDFRWKLEGDTFIQSGTIIRPDGKVVTLEALVFQRVTAVKPHPENPAIGTWQQLSSFYTTDSKKNSSFNPGSDSRLLFVTPTHWMRINSKNKKFESAMYGTYTMKGDTIFTKVKYAPPPSKKGDQKMFIQKVKDNKINTRATGLTADGKKVIFDDSFQKVE